MRESNGAFTPQQQVMNNVGGGANQMNNMMLNQQNITNSVPQRNPMPLMNGGGSNIAMSDP